MSNDTVKDEVITYTLILNNATFIELTVDVMKMKIYRKPIVYHYLQ